MKRGDIVKFKKVVDAGDEVLLSSLFWEWRLWK